MITIAPAALQLSPEIAPILRALPQWFGIEEATQHYIEAASDHPTILARDTACGDLPIGFLTLRQHSPAAAEVYVMGVLPTYHRRGVGRALLSAAEAYLCATGVRFLQVKTLSDKHPDAGYRQTRAFYAAMGFCLLEEFPNLWGAHNPCWQLIKAL
jgi:ribosomal protein S18 acetylase RimI-like enzyme